jgi:hypothetical protein
MLKIKQQPVETAMKADILVTVFFTDQVAFPISDL